MAPRNTQIVDVVFMLLISNFIFGENQMTTTLSELIADLKIDMGENSLNQDTAKRALSRAIVIINKDLETDYKIEKTDNNKIQPDLDALHKEMLLLHGQIYFYKINMNQKPDSVSFKSGDKQVKKTSTKWLDIIKNLHDEYENLLRKEKPVLDNKSRFLTPDIKPAIYKRGKNNE